jgi:hypothetical protein
MTVVRGLTKRHGGRTAIEEPRQSAGRGGRGGEAAAYRVTPARVLRSE